MFRYPTVRYNITAINGMNFNRLMGFGFSSLFNASYYVADIVASKVHIFNDDWSYVSYKTFTRPTYMITIDRSIYMTGDINTLKVFLLSKKGKVLTNYSIGVPK